MRGKGSVSKQRAMKNYKFRQGSENKRKKEGTGVHKTEKDCGMDEVEGKRGDRERERPDLLHCDPVICGVGVTI